MEKVGFKTQQNRFREKRVRLAKTQNWSADRNAKYREANNWNCKLNIEKEKNWIYSLSTTCHKRGLQLLPKNEEHEQDWIKYTESNTKTEANIP